MTDTKTLTVTEFLLARIAEDEVDARAAVDDDEHWLHLGGGEIIQGDEGFRITSGWLRLPHRFEAADHITRHDPARVLAGCEAKRRIVTWVTAAQAAAGDPPGFCADDSRALGYSLRILAAVYSDHPDYRDEWAV